MAKTRHIQARMSQRGITSDMLDLVLRFGEQSVDKIVLSRKGTEAVIKELDNLRTKLLKILDKGGLVVEENNSLITAYRTDSFSIKASLRKSERNNGKHTSGLKWRQSGSSEQEEIVKQ